MSNSTNVASPVWDVRPQCADEFVARACAVAKRKRACGTRNQLRSRNFAARGLFHKCFEKPQPIEAEVWLTN